MNCTPSKHLPCCFSDCNSDGYSDQYSACSCDNGHYVPDGEIYDGENGYSHLEWEQRQEDRESQCSQFCRCFRCRKWTCYMCWSLKIQRRWSVVCDTLLLCSFVSCTIALIILSLAALRNYIKETTFISTECQVVSSE